MSDHQLTLEAQAIVDLAERENEALINLLAGDLLAEAKVENKSGGAQADKIVSDESISRKGSAAFDLMPRPAKVEARAETLPVGGGVKISFEGFRDPLLERAGHRFLSNLQKRTGLIDDSSLPAASLRIECKENDPGFGSLEAKEGYSLSVDKSGIVLKADGQTGVLRGLATLQQLVELKPEGFQFAGAKIEDEPRFPWRGLLVDPARHFISMDTLKRNIDAMEAVKLNVFHLHLSDNEGFRVESKRFPKLHEKESGGQYYTQEQIKELIAYARECGVRIIPEFDMPGHSGSEVRAYPEIGTPAGPGKEPHGVLDPSRETTYKWIESFLDEMTQLFPDKYYHMGGDEVFGGGWAEDPNIAKFMKENNFKDADQLQAYFSNRFKEMLDKRGKTMLGWDEIVNPKLSKDVLVHSWRSYEATAESARAGYPVIVSNGYYTDMLTPSDKHYEMDPAEPTGVLQSDDGKKKDPIVLSEEERKRIIGGQAAMWGELATDELIDARNWPRSAAIAERFWSPKTERNIDEMYRRLIIIDNILASTGLNNHANPQRMVSRLVPDRPEVVNTFLSAVKPAPNWNHFRNFRTDWSKLTPIQQFNELADIADPDALRTKRLELDVKRYLASDARDEMLKTSIKAQLRHWRDNHDQFVAIADRSPILKSAVSRSRDLRDLSDAALQAMDLIEKGQKPESAWLSKQNELVDQQFAFDDATKDMGSVKSKLQPPADLILGIHPTVRLLLDRATQK